MARAGFTDTTGSVGSDLYAGYVGADPKYDKNFVNTNVKPYQDYLPKGFDVFKNKDTDQQLLDIAAKAVMGLNKVGAKEAKPPATPPPAKPPKQPKPPRAPKPPKKPKPAPKPKAPKKKKSPPVRVPHQVPRVPPGEGSPKKRVPKKPAKKKAAPKPVVVPHGAIEPRF